MIGAIGGLLIILALFTLPVLFVMFERWANAVLTVLAGSKQDLLIDGNLCRERLKPDDFYWDLDRYKPEAKGK